MTSTAMSHLWEHSDGATITHPGWPTLRGWAKVLASWDAIFRNTPYIQFFLTDERVDVQGDVGWVTLSENILQAGSPDDDDGGGEDDGGGLHGSAVAAVNLFTRTPGGWRVVVHHGSPLA